MKEFYMCLSIPEEHFSPSDNELLPKVIIKGEFSSDTKIGKNTLLFAPESFKANKLYYNVSEDIWTEKEFIINFNFAFFDANMRSLRGESYQNLSEAIGGTVDVNLLYPFILLGFAEDEVIVYHHLAVGKRGVLFVSFEKFKSKNTFLSAQNVISFINESKDKWNIARKSYNQACWYSKWRPELEMERKYTFKSPVDTWKLVHILYEKIMSGELNGFIPEFNDEFQVWDFENFMFEVIEPENLKGYISFIPQSNGKMTVKQKYFQEDSEIRKETINYHVNLKPDQMESYAQELCQGKVRFLPPYRRKRFDINLESLETGNVYGVFFDICRPFGDNERALYQCEVEYIRSRTIRPLNNVFKEYEEVCNFTKDFLQEMNCEFFEGFYSKLSFLRDYTAELEKQEVKI